MNVSEFKKGYFQGNMEVSPIGRGYILYFVSDPYAFYEMLTNKTAFRK